MVRFTLHYDHCMCHSVRKKLREIYFFCIRKILEILSKFLEFLKDVAYLLLYSNFKNMFRA